MRAVVVDDSPEMVNLLTHLCERNGIEVVAKAHSGNEIMRVYDAVEFDLLIIDLHLPDASGCDVARKIAEKKKVKVIIVTSDDDFETDKFPVLKKPFRINSFSSILKKL